METPVRRVTRSSTSGLGPSSAIKPPARPASSKKEIARRPFSDLTNDSPISGLMPAKTAGNTGCVYESTPRSKLRPAERPIGEDLLRMQVTTLLRKVEAEAGIAERSMRSIPDVFDSPMRLAAPTPANTPATGPLLPSEGISKQMRQTPPALHIATPVVAHVVPGDAERPAQVFVPTTAIMMPPASEIVMATTRTLRFDSPQKVVDGHHSVIDVPAEEVSSMASFSDNGSPFCNLEVALILERSPSPFLSTEDVLSAIEETCTAEVQATTRTLQFDSPAKQVPEAVDGVEESEESTTRAINFETPGKRAAAETVTIDCVFENSGETEDEDSWSVIVNVNTPEKNENIDAVPTNGEEEIEAMDFADNVLVDPSLHPIPPDTSIIWERRDIPSRAKSDAEEYEDCDDYEEEEDYGEETYEDGNDLGFDDAACEELCRGISHISVGAGEEEEEKKGLPSYEGKHTRFVYNSDDEIEEELVKDMKSRGDRVVRDSPGKMKLKGCATPKGRHLRFDEDDEDSD